MQDKQPLCSSEAQLRAPRLAEWGPTPETLADCPHLKPRVGAHLELSLAAPSTRPKQGTRGLRDSGPKQLDQPAALVTQAQSGWIGQPRKTQSQSVPPSPCDQGPKPLIS